MPSDQRLKEEDYLLCEVAELPQLELYPERRSFLEIVQSAFQNLTTL